MATAWRRGQAPHSLEPVALADVAPGPGRVTIAVEAVALDPFDATPIGRVPGVAAVGHSRASGQPWGGGGTAVVGATPTPVTAAVSATRRST